MTPPTFSLIVPVYRVEAYLAECVESILSQTFSDFELLLVDDGSPDGCPAMCDAYARRDPRVRVVHTPNGGVSRARNIGLERACGRYVMFVDSDDTILPQTLDVCQRAMTAQRLDLLQFSHSRATIPAGLHEAAGRALPSSDYLRLPHPVCVCGGVYRRTMIEERALRFHTDVRLGEDQLFVYDFLNACRRAMFIPDVLYCYRINPDSATHSPKPADLITSIQAFDSYRLKYPSCAPKFETMIVHFLFTRSLIMHTPLRSLIRLARPLRLSPRAGGTGSERLFVRLLCVSTLAALLFACAYHCLHRFHDR